MAEKIDNHDDLRTAIEKREGLISPGLIRNVSAQELLSLFTDVYGEDNKDMIAALLQDFEFNKDKSYYLVAHRGVGKETLTDTASNLKSRYANIMNVPGGYVTVVIPDSPSSEIKEPRIKVIEGETQAFKIVDRNGNEVSNTPKPQPSFSIDVYENEASTGPMTPDEYAAIASQIIADKKVPGGSWNVNKRFDVPPQQRPSVRIDSQNETSSEE